MDKFKFSVVLIAAIVALADAAYIVFLGIQIYQIQAGVAALSPIFKPLSTAVIVANSALLCYTILYLVLRKR